MRKQVQYVEHSTISLDTKSKPQNQNKTYNVIKKIKQSKSIQGGGTMLI